MNQAMITRTPMAPMQMPVVRRRNVTVQNLKSDCRQEAHEVRCISPSC